MCFDADGLLAVLLWDRGTNNMGCFSFTCTVSGLPINAGTPVRYITLVDRPYDNIACYTSSRFALRCPPIKAEYNDYGSIENFDLNDPCVKVLLTMFKEDAVELPIGENPCHDVRVDLGMPFEKWLEALWEGRVFVSDHADYERRNQRMAKMFPDPEGPLPGKFGQPEYRRIEAQLKLAGHEVSESGFGAEDISHGFVRVRWLAYSEIQDKIAQVAALFGDEYAVVIVSGRGCITGQDLLIFPKPNAPLAQDENTNRITHLDFQLRKPEDFHHRVHPAMVREDVWQWLINYTTTSWRGEFSVHKLYDDAKDHWDFCRQNPDRRWMMMRENPVAMALVDSESGSSLGKSWTTAIETLTDEEGEIFHRQIAETIKFDGTLYSIRYMWHPGHTVGEQFGTHDHHAEFFQFLADTSKREVAKLALEYGENEDAEEVSE